MKKYILFLSLSFLNSNISADANIFGYWLTSGSIVKVENCDNLVCGKIITVFVEDGIDPNSILDKNNKNKSLRERTLVGVDLLSKFQINSNDQKTFKGGKIYDPRSGRTYNSNLYFKSSGNLMVEGCLRSFCRGEEWQPLTIEVNDDGTMKAKIKNSSQNN